MSPNQKKAIKLEIRQLEVAAKEAERNLDYRLSAQFESQAAELRLEILAEISGK